MKYITDLFEFRWNDKLVDRTDDIKAERQRLAQKRNERRIPSVNKNVKAPKTHS